MIIVYSPILTHIMGVVEMERESFNIYDNYGKDLIFFTYVQKEFKEKVRELMSAGVDVNGPDSSVRTNVKVDGIYSYSYGTGARNGR